VVTTKQLIDSLRELGEERWLKNDFYMPDPRVPGGMRYCALSWLQNQKLLHAPQAYADTCVQRSIMRINDRSFNFESMLEELEGFFERYLPNG
jgi:hypothetical protein